MCINILCNISFLSRCINYEKRYKILESCLFIETFKKNCCNKNTKNKENENKIKTQ